MISLLKKDVNLCLSQLDYNNPGVGIGFTLQSFVCLIYFFAFGIASDYCTNDL